MPSAKTVEAVQRQQPTRELRTEKPRSRDRDHEPGDDASAIGGRYPEGQIEDGARKEARFCRTKDKPSDAEGDRPLDQGAARRGYAPRHHDPSDPEAGSDLL